jgi:hypothetical protein
MKTLSDRKGRLYAAKYDLKAGDQVEIDHDKGFHCLELVQHPVLSDNAGRLYIVCKFGKHYIDPHLDDSSSVYSGLYKVVNPKGEEIQSDGVSEKIQ